MTQSAPKNPLSSLLLLVAVVAAFGGLYWFQSSPRKPETATAALTAPTPGQFTKALAIGTMEGVVIAAKRGPVDAFTFAKADGTTTDLSAWKGRVVLLNLWATWCGPCRREMPDLAALQKQLGGKDFEVVALSVDRKGKEASEAFLRDVGAENLAIYTDPDMQSMTAVQAVGLPATILIDRNGKEAARRLGPAEWSSSDAVMLIRTLMNEVP
jgi:thiol-disulfide isomerase/thioredoxin